ncbi:ATP-binding protein [Planobispora longispora]|uniref:ATP-binding protein n=1 Tax=Planobispora longispora TaxID=28887 RepID=A0A8J3W6D2_9ACTN|nr:ATP-binding protein [Planobispora longispora]BFE83833.1 ATP-binding protein [Planobispora longispora]GIH78364.1 ATP-binding protein [Planobispora longispora]
MSTPLPAHRPAPRQARRPGPLTAPLLGRPAAVPQARAWAQDLLADQGADTRYTALLLLSELITNAVIHSDSGRGPDGTVTVYLGATDGLVHIEVIDDGSAASMPFLRAADPTGDSGRGLALVEALAAKWGVHHDEETGTAVWCQIDEAEEGDGLC